MQLTSTRNPFLQDIRRAATTGRATDEGRIVIEGPHLLEESLNGHWRVEQILVTPEARDRYGTLLSRSDAPVTEVSARAFESLTDTETSQEIMALLTPVRSSWMDCLKQNGLVVVLDGIQDPGNAGTIVRSAEAFGASGVIFLEGSVRAANGKFLRASAGSIFRMPYLENQTRGDAISQLKASHFRIYALAAQATTPLRKTDLRQASAIVVGSEANGVSPTLLACAEGLRIPTSQVESLNAAVACSIVLFEAASQREKREPVR